MTSGPPSRPETSARTGASHPRILAKRPSAAILSHALTSTCSMTRLEDFPPPTIVWVTFMPATIACVAGSSSSTRPPATARPTPSRRRGGGLRPPPPPLGDRPHNLVNLPGSEGPDAAQLPGRAFDAALLVLGVPLDQFLSLGGLQHVVTMHGSTRPRRREAGPQRRLRG